MSDNDSFNKEKVNIEVEKNTTSEIIQQVDSDINLWTNIMNKYKNSVLQLICTIAVYNPYRPYHTPKDKRQSGSGFIIDISKGLVLTNAHVVGNAITISGRMMMFGEKDLSLKLISICREKDVALCQLSKIDTEKILSLVLPENINMKFGDDNLLVETDPVITIGFPLGQRNVKFTTGIVSGFHTYEMDDEDDLETEEETPSYIQITAPLNNGISGSPLLNSKGEVVGINSAAITLSQNIGYAIGTRIILSIYKELIAPLTNTNISIPNIVITPKYSFSYNRASTALLESSCNDDNIEGIYVNQVYPNSVFDTLLEGDIITTIIYEDPYYNNSSTFNIINKQNKSSTKLTAKLDKFGDLHINLTDSDKTTTFRKRSLKELFDTIQIFSEVSLIICRKENNKPKVISTMYGIKSNFKYIFTNIRTYLYPRFTKYKYIIVAGMCIGELTMNHIENAGDLEKYAKGKKRFQPLLIVNQIFPNTTADYTKVFGEGSIIKEVNGIKITTIDELTEAIKNSIEYISFVGKNHEKLVTKKEETILEDSKLIKQFEIPNYISPF